MTPPGVTGVGPVWLAEQVAAAWAVVSQLVLSRAVDQSVVVAVWFPMPSGATVVVMLPAGSWLVVVMLPLPSAVVVSKRVPPLVPPAVVSGMLSVSEVRVAPV